MSEKINNTTLKEYRKVFQLSMSEVAKFAGTNEKVLKSIEDGLKQPTQNQIFKLSQLYNIDFYKLYTPNTPPLREILPDFRKPVPTRLTVSAAGLSTIWKTENRSSFIQEIRTELGLIAPTTTPLPASLVAGEIDASQFREEFDDWREATAPHLKFSGDEDLIFFNTLRMYLETHNCHTSSNAAPINDYHGFFSKTDNGANVIFINRDIKNSRRKIFTLAHEMFHFIVGLEGISDPFVVTNDVERLCNRLAAEFLAPEKIVRTAMDTLAATNTRDGWAKATELSRLTNLSIQASAMRLAELGYINRSEKSSIFRRFSSYNYDADTHIHPHPPKSTPMGRNVAVGKCLSEVGILPTYTAYTAIKNRLIDKTDASRCLGIPESLLTSVLDLAARRYEGAMR